jgi:hypothetical protein
MNIDQIVYSLLQHGPMPHEEFKRKIVQAAVERSYNPLDALRSVRHVVIRDGEVYLDQASMPKVEAAVMEIVESKVEVVKAAIEPDVQDAMDKILEIINKIDRDKLYAFVSGSYNISEETFQKAMQAIDARPTTRPGA